MRTKECSSKLPIIFFFEKELTIPQALEPNWYRGDHRPPREIFNQGFTAKGRNMNLLDHINPTGYVADNTGYISTSTSKSVASKFPKLKTDCISFLYEVNPHKKAIDVIKNLDFFVKQRRIHIEDAQILMDEKEKAIPKKIKARDIKGAWKTYISWDEHEEVRTLRYISKEFISNPNYKPRDPSIPTTLLKIAKPVGYSLTGLGIILDGANVLQAYQESQIDNNQHIFFNEAARVISAWSGDFALGATCAKIGANVCRPLGIYGVAGCSITAGLVGSVLGYFMGEKFSTKIPQESLNHLLPSKINPLKFYHGGKLEANVKSPKSKQELVLNEIRHLKGDHRLLYVIKDRHLQYANLNIKELIISIEGTSLEQGDEADCIYHHSDLASHQPVYSAGRIFIHDGYIVAIDNHSGGYKPKAYYLKEFIEDIFTEYGYDEAKNKYLSYKITDKQDVKKICRGNLTNSHSISFPNTMMDKKIQAALASNEPLSTLSSQPSETIDSKLHQGIENLIVYQANNGNLLFKPIDPTCVNTASSTTHFFSNSEQRKSYTPGFFPFQFTEKPYIDPDLLYVDPNHCIGGYYDRRGGGGARKGGGSSRDNHPAYIHCRQSDCADYGCREGSITISKGDGSWHK